jgi:hypothetical protein
MNLPQYTEASAEKNISQRQLGYATDKVKAAALDTDVSEDCAAPPPTAMKTSHPRKVKLSLPLTQYHIIKTCGTVEV